MERLTKIAIYLGMGIAIAIFSMVAMSFLSDVVRHDRWEDMIPQKSEQEVRINTCHNRSGNTKLI